MLIVVSCIFALTRVKHLDASHGRTPLLFSAPIAQYDFISTEILPAVICKCLALSEIEASDEKYLEPFFQLDVRQYLNCEGGYIRWE